MYSGMNCYIEPVLRSMSYNDYSSACKVIVTVYDWPLSYAVRLS